MRSGLAVTACGIAVAFAAWLVLGRAKSYASQQPNAAPPVTTRSPAPEAGKQVPPEPSPAPKPAPKVEPDAGPKDGFLSLPDGTRVPALNGVARPVELRWPAERPWSPITGRQTDPDGLQWYVHADGSRSTTQMVWRSDLGRKVPMSVVANPAKVVPMKSVEQEEREAGKPPRGHRFAPR